MFNFGGAAGGFLALLGLGSAAVIGASEYHDNSFIKEAMRTHNYNQRFQEDLWQFSCDRDTAGIDFLSSRESIEEQCDFHNYYIDELIQMAFIQHWLRFCHFDFCPFYLQPILKQILEMGWDYEMVYDTLIFFSMEDLNDCDLFYHSSGALSYDSFRRYMIEHKGIDVEPLYLEREKDPHYIEQKNKYNVW